MSEQQAMLGREQFEREVRGLELLRKPFPSDQISKLPKPTKAQTDAVKQNYKVGIRCKICGTWHHPDVVHLDYVGHAALTNRLLDADPEWTWEPLAVGPDGYPVIDKDGGMWIKLTVCGVTRLGYGDAQGKTGGDAMKERIGDALRNAAMRFGAALDLWHKGDKPLDSHEDQDADAAKHDAPKQPSKPECAAAVFTKNIAKIDGTKDAAEIIAAFETRYTLSDAQKQAIEDAVDAARERAAMQSEDQGAKNEH